MADQVPLMGDYSRRTGRLMYLNGLGSMPLSMDDDEEQAPDPAMLDGGDAAGQDDAELAQMEQDLEQGGVKGDGVPSSPLNVTPLSTRTAAIGTPPTRTDQVLGLLSDVAAGALAGSQFKSRPGTALRGGGVSPGLAATLGGFAGIQAGEQNRIQREVRRRAFDQQDFQRQQALYVAELNQAKYNRTEDRLDAQANAVKAHYRLMEQKARIDGKKLLLEMKNGTITVIGNNAWRFWPDGRSQQITNTEQGAKAVSIKMWRQQAKVMGLSDKETNQGILKILNPSFKTDVEIATEEKTERDKPENVAKRKEASSREWLDSTMEILPPGSNRKDLIYALEHARLLPPGVSRSRAIEMALEIEHKEKANVAAVDPADKPPTRSELLAAAKDAKADLKTAQQDTDEFAVTALIDKTAGLYPMLTGADLIRKAAEIAPHQTFNEPGKPWVNKTNVLEIFKKLKEKGDGDTDAATFMRRLEGGGGGSTKTTAPAPAKGKPGLTLEQIKEREELLKFLPKK